MHRYFFADAMRFVDDGLGLFVGEIYHRMEHAICFEMVTTVGVVFDPIRSIHRLFAYRFARAVGSIYWTPVGTLSSQE